MTPNPTLDTNTQNDNEESEDSRGTQLTQINLTPQGKQNKMCETWKHERIKQETGEHDTGVEERQMRGSKVTRRSTRERDETS